MHSTESREASRPRAAMDLACASSRWNGCRSAGFRLEASGEVLEVSVDVGDGRTTGPQRSTLGRRCRERLTSHWRLRHQTVACDNVLRSGDRGSPKEADHEQGAWMVL